jgi:oxygen-independent coproporphyrinogen-3 oxidase
MARALETGTLRRNFQGYTTDQARTLLGLGASAIGGLAQGFVQNATQELAWREAVKAGRLPVVRGVAFTAEDRLRGDIIERLMCEFRVDLAAVCAAHGWPVEAMSTDLARLEPFIADGLVRVHGTSIAVTPAGRVLVRSIAAAFDGYFNPDSQRHAKAI